MRLAADTNSGEADYTEGWRTLWSVEKKSQYLYSTVYKLQYLEKWITEYDGIQENISMAKGFQHGTSII